MLLGFFFAFLGTGFFSLKSIFIKLAFAEGLDADSVLMLRMAISLPVYLIIMLILACRSTERQITIRPFFMRIIGLGFIGYFLASWLDLKGLEYISAGLERLTLFAYPTFVAILGALFLRIPLTKSICASLVLTYFGLWLVFRQEMTTAPNSVDTTVGWFGFAFSAQLCFLCSV